MKLSRTTLVLAAAALVMSACAAGERSHTPRTQPRLQPRPVMTAPVAATLSARDVYAAGIAGYTDPAELRGWEEASRLALRSGLSIPPSFRERVRFPAGSPHAVAYRFALRQGDVLHVRVVGLDGGRPLFADVFQPVAAELFRPVHSAPAGESEFIVEARVTGAYVLRLQPELGSGGLYEVLVEGASGSLLFPVADAGLDAVGSWFGDARDGGARGHEGIDIFAPRSTPVVAVAAGRVTSARNTPVGGLVVWIDDAGSDLTYYYAHLDEIHAREGAFVAAGDTIGTVGNTGNARGVRPHLHFGIYRPGRVALDPAPLLATGAPVLADDAEVDSDMLGRWARVNGDRVRLRSSPNLGGAILAELTPATPLFVLGGVADWHRVLLPDGMSGFVSARFTAATDEAGR
jgi:peptidoglycan LD-endopeptidase LytH